jgi:hypothetical protein
VQKGIFVSKTENITRKRRKLHNGEFHDQRKKSEMERPCGGHGVEKGCKQGFGVQTSWKVIICTT